MKTNKTKKIPINFTYEDTAMLVALVRAELHRLNTEPNEYVKERNQVFYSETVTLLARVIALQNLVVEDL